MVVFLLLLVPAVVFLIWCIKHRSPVDESDTVIAFTGGLGAGKTAYAVHLAVKIFKRRRFWAKIFRRELPELYSNIPIRIGKYLSAELDNDITLLARSVPRGSVVLIDEIGSYCSQFDYRAKNVERLDEFVRFFRHYVRGTLIVTDQCSENIVLQIRRRLNVVYNLQRFRKKFFPFCTVDIRPISISEEVKSFVQVNENANPDGFYRVFFLGNPFRFYDSYCYSIRYDLPRSSHSGRRSDRRNQSELKTNRLFTIDKLTDYTKKSLSEDMKNTKE